MELRIAQLINLALDGVNVGAAFTREEPQYPTNRRLGWLQRQSGTSVEEKKNLTRTGNRIAIPCLFSR
jgi:hypothetical protein